jgi:choline-sulfatase
MTPAEAIGQGISRRRFLERSAATAGSLWLGGLATGAARGAQGPPASLAGMNVVMFVTDQERALQHFPPGWSERNLPGLRQLQRHG